MFSHLQNEPFTFRMLKVKLQYCSRHSPWKIATGSSGWRSNTSWRSMLGSTWSVPSAIVVLVCQELWGRWQRGRLWWGGKAGWLHGANQPAKAWPPMCWPMRGHCFLPCLAGRREPAGGLSSKAGSRSCWLGVKSLVSLDILIIIIIVVFSQRFQYHFCHHHQSSLLEFRFSWNCLSNLLLWKRLSSLPRAAKK